MSKDKPDIAEISRVVTKIFNSQGSGSIIGSKDYGSLEEFKQFLAEKISWLMDNKFDLLINILYRIDIGEDKLQRLFADKDRHNIPEALSDLIIERQLQKIEFREKHRQGIL